MSFYLVVCAFLFVVPFFLLLHLPSFSNSSSPISSIVFILTFSSSLLHFCPSASFPKSSVLPPLDYFQGCLKFIPVFQSRDSSVVMAMGYGMDGRGSVAGRATDFFLLLSTRTSSGVCRVSYSMGIRGSILGGKDLDVKLTTHFHPVSRPTPFLHTSSWHVLN
jgi:hypothetical protein